MAKQTIPSFLDFDFTKFMDPKAFLDPKAMDMSMSKFFDVPKMMGDLKMDGVMQSQQRTLDAFSQANRLAVEGARAIAERQMEIVRQGMEDASAVAAQMASSATPNERLARQTELYKDLYERSVSNLKELSEMASKSNGEVVDVLNTRFSEALDEMKAMIEKAPEMPAFPMAAAPAPATKPAAKTNGAATKAAPAAKAQPAAAAN